MKYLTNKFLNSFSGTIGMIFRVPVFIGFLLYAILLPDTLYFALGINFDIWLDILQSFWGYLIVIILFSIPLLNIGLGLLLLFQSIVVTFKFIFGSYNPSLHGFITMIPALVIFLAASIALFSKEK